MLVQSGNGTRGGQRLPPLVHPLVAGCRIQRSAALVERFTQLFDLILIALVDEKGAQVLRLRECLLLWLLLFCRSTFNSHNLC